MLLNTLLSSIKEDCFGFFSPQEMARKGHVLLNLRVRCY